jgi:hypothetical protein
MRGIFSATDKGTDIADSVNVHKRVEGCNSWHMASTSFAVSLPSTQNLGIYSPLGYTL